ncbi:PLP-dependent aminotransferase family protein [Nereida sp. MMG025]|uniref:aminotransferase-like domain-containing protein n=1 Tax=Nereida sp. MMG025 TaxID=2909981 RepID=UPI001F187421|nr:PLP-dependent aminotransferase family protein [Nereida sp. MMG025]MCF6443241.1 PLP-dependent aminotransferase family protein [Nereida sp. MMG025]
MNTIWVPKLPEGMSSKYKAVAQAIRNAVATGELPQGTKLPPVRDLSWRLEMTPGTVARAYTILTDEGLLQAEVGRGTFVAAPKTQVLDDVWSRLKPDDSAAMINLFSPRLPDMGQVALMRAAFAKVAKAEPLEFLNYPIREDYKPARQAVVDWMSDVLIGPLAEQHVVFAHGGQSAISLVMQAVLTGPKPVIMVEDLCYPGFRRAAETLRADVVAVPMDEHGPIPAEVERIARNTGAQLLCLTPEVQNPTGGFCPLARREALVAVAKRCDFDILEDDCYRIGTMQAPTFRSLYKGRAWYVTSISKSLTPSLRIGFAIAPEGRASDLRRYAEYGFFGIARPLAEVTRLILADPAAKQIADAVRKQIGAYLKVGINELGGYDVVWRSEVPFLWMRLPDGWRAEAFVRAAEREGVQIRSADEFALRDGRAPHAVRISVNAHISIDLWGEAMVRLRKLLDNPPETIAV